MVFIDMGESIPKKEIIPTPSLGLNNALGGGLKTGAFHAFWGSNQTGKTTFALQIMARAQREYGMIPFIIDSENSIEDSYLQKNGIDPEKRLYFNTTVVEEAVSKVKSIFEANPDQKFIYLVDSLNALYFAKYLDEPDNSGMAYAARSQTALLNKLSPYMGTNLCIVVAQQTMNLGGTVAFHDAKIAEALKHDCSTIIRLQKSNNKKFMTVEDNGNISEYAVNWKVDKTKQGPERGTGGRYYFKPAEVRIDTAREILTLAALNDLIQVGGAGWYTINGDKVQGEPAAVDYLREHDLVDSLYDQLQDINSFRTSEGSEDESEGREEGSEEG